MKVKELIKQLSDFDENLDVVFLETINENEQGIAKSIVSYVDGVIGAENDEKLTMVVLCSKSNLKIVEEDCNNLLLYVTF